MSSLEVVARSNDTNTAGVPVSDVSRSSQVRAMVCAPRSSREFKRVNAFGVKAPSGSLKKTWCQPESEMAALKCDAMVIRMVVWP